MSDPAANDLKLRVGMTVAEAERRLLMLTLDHTCGDKKRAAELAGISVRTLYNKLATYRRQDAAAEDPR